MSRKFEKVFISAVIEGFLVDWCCFAKDFLSYEIWNSRLFVDCGKLLIMCDRWLEFLLV